MARASLVDQVVDQLLDDISAGRMAAEQPLSPEADLASRFGVSRLTLREALQVLRSGGVVRAVPGTRSVVNPVERWTDLAFVLRAAARRDDAAHDSLQLVELRRIIETGAAELAAVRRTDRDLDRLAALLADMVTAHGSGDLQAFVVADIAFHDVVLAACGNIFLPPLLTPLSRLMYERRVETSASPAVQRHAIDQHAAILDALRSGEPAAARAAMDAHMDQTARDLRTFVLRT